MTQPFNPGVYTEEDLRGFGIKCVGSNVRIARNCTISGLENISIGSNVMIDGYCTIYANRGWLDIGSYVHIGAYCTLIAGGGIRMEDFSGISQGVRLYSGSDDYTGQHLTNPTVPQKYLGTTRGTITLSRHVIIGSGSVVLPGVAIGEGSAVGALCLVTKSLEPWGVYFGRPVKRLKARSKRLLDLEQELLRETAEGQPVESRQGHVE